MNYDGKTIKSNYIPPSKRKKVKRTPVKKRVPLRRKKGNSLKEIIENDINSSTLFSPKNTFMDNVKLALIARALF